MGIQEPEWVRRYITCFSKETQHLIAEIDLPNLDLVELQKVWSRPETDPMFMCYPVGEAQQAFLQKAANIRLDLDAHLYFLEAACTDWRTMHEEGGFMGQYAAPLSLMNSPDAMQLTPEETQANQEK